MKKLLTSSLLAGLLATTSLQAFDEQKEGFVLNIGAGFSSITTDLTYGTLGADESSFGFATSFKIGYGFTNQFLLYYINDVSWYGYDKLANDDTYISALTGIGASYYPEEGSPYYLMGAIGIGSIANISENVGERGSAFMIGGGYEFSPHLNIEANYLATNIEENSVELSTGALRLTLNYMWY